jgi:GDP-4-dehydro-6-deoxy-D-mannose reductase
MADEPAPRLCAFSAVFTVSDVGRSLRFFVERLRFVEQFRLGDPVEYAILDREAVSLHLMPASRGPEALGRSSIYVFVERGDALVAELRAARPDAVLHLAAVASVADAFRRSRETWEVNATGSLVLLDAVAEAAPDARVVLVSSCEVYGVVDEARQPIGEDAPLRPRSPYAAAKAAAEMAAAAAPLDVVVARPFPHIGPGQDERFAIASFAAQLHRIERGEAPPRLQVGNLDARRDLCDVRDVADAYLRLLSTPGLDGAYNVCRGEAFRIGDVLDRLRGLIDAPVEVVVDPERLRPLDVPLLLGDPARLHAATGWRAARPLDATLQDVLTAFRTQGSYA